MICPIGDLNGQTEISIIHRNDRFEMTDTSSGALVPAHFAIQGGFVLYASVKAKNIDGCSVIVKAVLWDICDNAGR